MVFASRDACFKCGVQKQAEHTGAKQDGATKLSDGKGGETLCAAVMQAAGCTGETARQVLQGAADMRDFEAELVPIYSLAVRQTLEAERARRELLEWDGGLPTGGVGP